VLNPAKLFGARPEKANRQLVGARRGLHPALPLVPFREDLSLEGTAWCRVGAALRTMAPPRL